MRAAAIRLSPSSLISTSTANSSRCRRSIVALSPPSLGAAAAAASRRLCSGACASSSSSLSSSAPNTSSRANASRLSEGETVGRSTANEGETQSSSSSSSFEYPAPVVLSSAAFLFSMLSLATSPAIATEISSSSSSAALLSTSLASVTSSSPLPLLPQVAATVAELDPSTAASLASLLRPVFALAELLFIVRIVLTWYPAVDGDKLPWAIVIKPTEPLLVPTRKFVPPLAGVDVSPVVWVALLSFFSEILVGPQGILVLLSRKVGAA